MVLFGESNFKVQGMQLGFRVSELDSKEISKEI